MHSGAILRIARPTDNLAAIAAMYAKALDFTVLAGFTTMIVLTVSSSGILSTRTIWNSPRTVDTRSAEPCLVKNRNVLILLEVTR